MKKILVCIFLLGVLNLEAQKFKGLAMTPPMGWNSWNTFQTKIDEQLVKDIADIMVSSGMKDAGYTYIVLDDGWMAMERNSAGDLVPDPVKFPHGMKALADYVHSKGLKFGLYNCAGTKTCAGYPGTKGFEDQDARLYASFGIDYLKFDWCNTQGMDTRQAYTKMSNALKAAGRPMIFSLCEWGTSKPWEWAAEVGQLWRTTGDIYRCFEGLKDMGTWRANCVMRNVDLQADLRRYAGPDHWNDPDMLEVGNGMTETEDRAHFSLWCMMAAPLIAGNDFRSMSQTTLHILSQKELIAIDQDPLGIQGFRISGKDSIETWYKPLNGNDWAICILNRSSMTQKIHVDWNKQQVLDSLTGRKLNTVTEKMQVRDLWAGRDLGQARGTYEALLPSRDVIVLRLSPSK